VDKLAHETPGKRKVVLWTQKKKGSSGK